MDANRVEQQSRHQPRHTTSDDTDGLGLSLGHESCLWVLSFQVGNTVEPGSVRVVDVREGVSPLQGLGALDGLRSAENAQVGEGVDTAAGGDVFGGEPNETSATNRCMSVGSPLIVSKGSIRLLVIVVSVVSTDLVVRLGVVVESTVAVYEDDIAGEKVRLVIADVHVDSGIWFDFFRAA